MGSVCCCLNFRNFEDNVNPDNPAYGNCICLSCFVNNFSNVYTSLFRRGEVHSFSTSIQGVTSLTSTASFDNCLPDMYHSPPFPLPYDAEPRYIRLQRDGPVSSRAKGSSHLHGELEPLRSDIDMDMALRAADKLNRSTGEDESRDELRRSSLKYSSAKKFTAVEKNYAMSEDENVCPTCLEAYTPENPKIMTKCSHDFHLGCIYEWMERSESCPVCGKLMAFDEMK